MAKGKKGRPSFWAVAGDRFGSIALAMHVPKQHERWRENENENKRECECEGGMGMGMGNGLLSSFGAWPGPKRPVKVIGKVTEIVAHSTLGAGQ